MGAGLLFALTLPGLVVLLIMLALVERACSRRGRRSLLSSQPRPGLSASGLDVFAAAVSPGKATELEQRRVEEQLREDEDDGAAPRSRIDFDARTAHLRLPPGSVVPRSEKKRPFSSNG
jgi:hypothetical protein